MLRSRLDDLKRGGVPSAMARSSSSSQGRTTSANHKLWSFWMRLLVLFMGTAMLSWTAESVGLEWRPPPYPEHSRLDDWYLGVLTICIHPWYLFFQKFMKRSLDRGRHPILPETELVLLPPSLPSMAERPRGTWRSPQSSMLLQYSCGRKLLLPGRVICISHPRPVSA